MLGTFSRALNTKVASGAAAASRVPLPAVAVPRIVWRMPKEPISEDYVMPWPSSTIPTRGTPGVSAAYSVDVHPDSQPSRSRHHVALDYDYPMELLNTAPVPRRVRPAAGIAPRGAAESEAAWPVSPVYKAAPVAADFIYDWPSSQPVRAARPRIIDESYIYEWPSCSPRASKPMPTHVMSWRAAPGPTRAQAAPA
mmetsp:Transcript_6503/g.17682  ORF Transcript_6503/g.17682 Transcript_6503/m.17682 type:complete len:196 (+) Transcript_6503:86-673(+)